MSKRLIVKKVFEEMFASEKGGVTSSGSFKIISVIGLIIAIVQIVDYWGDGCFSGFGGLPDVCGSYVVYLLLVSVSFWLSFPARLIFRALRKKLKASP